MYTYLKHSVLPTCTDVSKIHQSIGIYIHTHLLVSCSLQWISCMYILQRMLGLFYYCQLFWPLWVHMCVLSRDYITWFKVDMELLSPHTKLMTLSYQHRRSLLSNKQRNWILVIKFVLTTIQWEDKNNSLTPSQFNQTLFPTKNLKLFCFWNLVATLWMIHDMSSSQLRLSATSLYKIISTKCSSLNRKLLRNWFSEASAFCC